MKRGGVVKHGLINTPIYSSWMNMKARCTNPASDVYPNYGGRGIRICAWLRASPLNLQNLIGFPLDGCSLNRINNEGHYSCGSCTECKNAGWNRNVEWATKREQCRNTRRNHYLTLNGERHCEIEWSEILGIKVRTIIARLARGMTDEQALSKRRVRRSFIEARRAMAERAKNA